MAREKHPDIITVNRFEFRDGHTGPETEEVAAYRNEIYWNAVAELRRREVTVREAKEKRDASQSS